MDKRRRQDRKGIVVLRTPRQGGSPQGVDSGQNPWKIRQWDHVRAIARTAVRVRMGLKEKTVHTNGRRCTGQRFDHRAIPAGRSTEPSGLLDRMRRIENDRHT